MEAVPQGGTGTDPTWLRGNRRIQIMSEGLQHRHLRASRNMRAERTTTSCGECRRRKQKCDQQQPCGNCQRRFPQPVCEYRLGNRIPGTSTFPTPTRVGGRGATRDLPGGESPLPYEPQSSGTPAQIESRWPAAAIPAALSRSDTTPTSSSFSPGSIRRPDIKSEPQKYARPTLSTRLQLISGDTDYALDVDPSQASQQVLTFRRAFPDYVLGAENDGRKDEWTAEDEVIPVVWARSAQPKIQRSIGDMEDQFGHLPVAQTPLNKKLLRIYFDVLSRFKASLTGDPDPSNPFIKHYAPFCIQEPLVVQTIMYASACYIHETGHLPRTALMASKGRAIHMLNQRIGSGRNSAAANNADNVGETSGTNDAAIASVIQLAAAEWYWGDNNEDVQHHFRGLRDMIRLRGGFDRLGMNGILAKNAICHDVSIALAHENSPLLLLHSQEDCSSGGGGGGPRTPWTADYAFADPIKDVPLRMTHSAPFVCSLSSVGTLPSYAECSQSLGIHRATASILDNVRFLFRAVEAAYVATNDTTDPSTETATTTTTTKTRAPTKAASRKVQLMGRYIHEHIQSLHPTIPGHRQPSPEVSTRGNSPGFNYYAGADGGSTRSGSISSIGTAAGPSSGGPGRSPPEPGYDSTTTPEWASAPDASDSPTSPKSTAAAPRHHHHHHRQQQQQQNSDYMYQAIRATAIVYSRAIMNRTPLSVACTQPEFLQIWATVWRVPLSAWNSSVGTFHWIMLAIAPACHTTPHGRFVKNMLMVSTLSLGVDNWAVAMGAAKAGLKLQHWLKGQDAETESEEGAEEEDGEGLGDGGGRGGGRWRSGREER